MERPGRTLAAASVLLAALGAASCLGSYQVPLANGAGCTVTMGSKREVVRAACGSPTSYGMTPMMWQRKGCSIVACSAPGDIYGKLLIRYDCNGAVDGVETMPVSGFVEGAQ